jgi:branched-chain amino acid transport system substrate-binding protein
LLLKNKSILLLMLVVVFVVFGVFGCGQPATPPADDTGDEPAAEFEGQVVMGIMLPITGAVAENGIDMENAAKLAVAEINAAGGVLGYEIVTSTGDDGCDPAMATAAASKLVSEEVFGVVGGYCSGATLPTLKIYGDAGIPIVLAASNSTALIDENPGWAFLINSTGDMQAENAVAQFEKLGVETIGIIDAGDAYSADVKVQTTAQWTAKGFEVVMDGTVNPGEQDFSSLVTTIMSINPGGIYWTGYHAEGGLLVRQLREAGYEGVLMVADGTSDPAFIDIAGEYGEGVFLTAPPFADLTPTAQGFANDYRATYNRNPGAYAGLTYDAVYLLVDAVERAGSFDGAALRDELAATANWPGISGVVTFTDKNTMSTSNFVILVVKDGVWAFAE